MWSDNPTEDQILSIFHTPYTFKIMRMLMVKPMTIAELVNEIKVRNYTRIYGAIKFLKTKGLIKIKEHKLTDEYHKTAVFTTTLKNININISKETTITTDTKLELHSEGFE